ncbi:hypothetical protein [Pseudomonas syringae]|uniref:hypothetical protein n=1 Tax=Pseudomonas syringae TaxID=317 RepID=UPI00128F0E92|nr:hypothetical protein [Pseudomonas syringae]
MISNKILSFLLFTFLFITIPKSFADGGFFTMACTVSVACPAGQAGAITYKGTFSNRVIDSCSDVTKKAQSYINSGSMQIISNTCVSVAPVPPPAPPAPPSASFTHYGYNNSTQACPATQPQGVINIQQSYEVWSDGSVRNESGWYETSRSCAAVFSYYGYNNSTQACPAAQPQGQINIQQRYEVWSDGSTRNASAWSETSRTCVAVKSRTQTDTRSYSCPAGQSGAITQTRTYDVWSDGSTNNFTAWNVSNNTCAASPITANPTQRVEMCPEGYVGKITYHWVVYYTNDSYSATDSDGKLITYTLSTPHQQELVLSNTCTLIPSQGISTVPGHESMTCDKYYNSVKGTYIGDVIKYGNYVSSYDSSKKQTNTVFNHTSVDVTQCVADPEKTYSIESISVACDAGQSGIITKTRTVATAPSGTKSYPYGTDYTASSNTCTGTNADSAPAAVASYSKPSLIENLSLTSSMLSDSTYSTKIVDSLKSQSIKAGETHRLNLVVNDLSSGKYNATNVTNVVKAFKKAVGNGAEFKITLPRSIDKYAGNGGIQSGKGMSLSSSELDRSKLTVKYIDGTDKKSLSMPVEKTAEIQIFDGDLTGISFAQD